MIIKAKNILKLALVLLISVITAVNCSGGSNPKLQVVRTLKVPNGKVVKVVFTPDGQHLISVSTDQIVRLWSLKTGKIKWQTALNKTRPRAIDISTFSPGTIINGEPTFLEFSSKDKVVTIGGANDRWTKRFQLTTGKELPANVCPRRRNVHSVRSCASDGDTLLSWASDQGFYVWSSSTGKMSRRPAFPISLRRLEIAKFSQTKDFRGSR